MAQPTVSLESFLEPVQLAYLDRVNAARDNLEFGNEQASVANHLLLSVLQMARHGLQVVGQAERNDFYPDDIDPDYLNRRHLTHHAMATIAIQSTLDTYSQIAALIGARERHHGNEAGVAIARNTRLTFADKSNQVGALGLLRAARKMWQPEEGEESSVWDKAHTYYDRLRTTSAKRKNPNVLRVKTPPALDETEAEIIGAAAMRAGAAADAPTELPFKASKNRGVMLLRAFRHSHRMMAFGASMADNFAAITPSLEQVPDAGFTSDELVVVHALTRKLHSYVEGTAKLTGDLVSDPRFQLLDILVDHVQLRDTKTESVLFDRDVQKFARRYQVS